MVGTASAATPDGDGLYRLALSHPQGVTRVVVGPGAAAGAADALADLLAGKTLFQITTPRVLGLHGPEVRPLTERAGRLTVLEVVDGEEAKSLEAAGRLWREMLLRGGKRDSRVLAFGGGSCGDLAGFVAGTFLRGVPVIQVPTTLLAQVDAALGGKTAIDLPEAKNSVGLFHHPEAVVSDTRVLATLPEGELRSGLVEVVKMAFLLDPELLERVETDLPALLAGEPEPLAPVVARAAAAKIAVVEEDPGETLGPRRLLNFGHTLGHALETVLAYQGLRHGEAVAYGILFALRLAAPRGLPTADADRLRRLLGRFGLPPLPEGLAAEPLLDAMARDKKAVEGALLWVLPRRLGEGESTRDITRDRVARELPAFLADPWG